MHRLILTLLLLLCPLAAQATILGHLKGIVHDPQHRPIANAQITLTPIASTASITLTTSPTGTFSIPALPLGVYTIVIATPGFRPLQQTLTLASDTSPELHFELQLATIQQTATVNAQPNAANPDSVTPTTLISRQDIANTPGASRTNSLAMITDFVPGAYITHDMLHMRGGHQVTWQIDGVQIPNTNIASNLGAQIDPKDIDYLEIQRGSYNADIGDRTYGVFNVVPRTGFERNREAELVLSAGNFLQTNDHLSLADHTERFAWYTSLSANRTDNGLSPPVGRVLHDAANGVGTFASFLFNRTPKDQIRLVTQVREDFFQIPYDPDPDSAANQDYDSSGLRDTQHETDALAALSFIHTVNPATVLQVSPFFHFNRAIYTPNPDDLPVATNSNRSSNYAGLQASLTTTLARNDLQAGLFSFGQHDSYLFGSTFNDSSSPSFRIPDSASGGVTEQFLTDTLKPAPWLTLLAGLRASQFQGSFIETHLSPRFGAAVQIPRLHWVLRAFYGRFYQPPPLLTAAGPIVQFAQSNNTTFQPLHGERDEEHQFGLQIPFRGWLLDADTSKTRANNFLDHANIGESSLYYPVTIDGALIQAWELTVRSPRISRLGQAHLAFSNQIAKQRGAITGGLVCFPIGDPACAANFTYKPVDHDQRNTLNLGFDTQLPTHIGLAANLNYGSGFTNGSPNDQYPDDYLPHHTTLDLRLSRTFTQNTTLALNALNLTNRRVLLDNSLTFGGFHFNDPRQLYAELRFRFHF